MSTQSNLNQEDGEQPSTQQTVLWEEEAENTQVSLHSLPKDINAQKEWLKFIYGDVPEHFSHVTTVLGAFQ